jgi:serine/threonine protein phosphatase PrpC
MSPDPETKSLADPFTIDGKGETPCIFAVFDGMGGMSNGGYASLTAAELLGEWAPLILNSATSPGKTPEESEKSASKTFQKYIAQTNKLLCETMRRNASRLGTTLAVVIINDNVIWAYNLGDSRIYSLSPRLYAPSLSRSHVSSI